MSNSVKEDYVSVETAKLLEEKGFDWETRRCYLTNLEDIIDISDDVPLLRKNVIRIPTHQMAMKWLREVHKIGVFLTTYSIMRGNKIAYVYDAVIINLHTHTLMTEELEFEKDSYEEAAEAAIKYCLENLI